MNSITFSCEETLAMPPEEVARQILDLDLWPGFEGYGPLPGIRAAEFEIRTAEVVGTRIRVTNTDGSSHVEEIVIWEPGRRIRLQMGGFSPPLSRLATGFDETFEFEPTGEQTRVVRRFELHPRSVIARPLLWLISLMLKKAITRHLRAMKDPAVNDVIAGSSGQGRTS
jgi:uncharacterized protein YndB with AHSA1/START domain